MRETVKTIMADYAAGEKTLKKANEALEAAGAPFTLNPEKNVLTEQEKRATTVGYYPDQACGFGLLDTGTGTLDKVEIRHGRLVGCDCGQMPALLFMAGRMYHIHGSELED